MPTFIAHAPRLEITQVRTLARRFGIQSHAYEADDHYNPSDAQFKILVDAFDTFCRQNNNSVCDMFMLTGYHGDYFPAKLNNLNKAQLEALVLVAKKHHVTFQHIVADSCCAVFGLNELKDLLAHEGVAIGDRMTSTGYKLHDLLIEEMREINATLLDDGDIADEKKLIHDVVRKGILRFNAPICIINNNGEIAATGTNSLEIEKFIIKTYEDEGIIAGNLSHADAMVALRRKLPDIARDLNSLAEDLNHSRSIFPTLIEKDNRTALIPEHIELTQSVRQDNAPARAPQASNEEIQPYQEPERYPLILMNEENIDEISRLDKHIFPKEVPLGEHEQVI